MQRDDILRLAHPLGSHNSHLSFPTIDQCYLPARLARQADMVKPQADQAVQVVPQEPIKQPPRLQVAIAAPQVM